MKIMWGHLYQLKIFHIVDYKCKAGIKSALLFCELCDGGVANFMIIPQIIYNLFIDKLPNLWYNIITVKDTKGISKI